MSQFIAKFKCQGKCQKNLGVKKEFGARMCIECKEYFMCLECSKQARKITKCSTCHNKPKVCDQPGCNNPTKFGSCRSCWLKSCTAELDPNDPDIAEIQPTEEIEEDLDTNQA